MLFLEVLERSKIKFIDFQKRFSEKFRKFSKFSFCHLVPFRIFHFRKQKLSRPSKLFDDFRLYHIIQN